MNQLEYAIVINKINKDYTLYSKPSQRLVDALGLAKKGKYRIVSALKDVTFNIERGKSVGIIGSNGSGKSTLLKIITGVLNPSSGNMQVDGRISALLELGAGFNQDYTGIENIYLNGTMNGYTREEVEKKLDAILEFADIGDYIYQAVKTYSSGMFVRLAFAVAINIDPEILIVDEALSVGDVFFQAKCYRKFEEFRKMGKTILFVSHDLGSIAKYCDSVILLDKGVLLGEGDPKTMIDNYKKVMVGQYSLIDNGEEISDGVRTISNHEILDYENIDNIYAQDESSSNSIELNPNIIEYGNKNAEIIEYSMLDSSKVPTSAVMKGDIFTISMRVRANITIKSPIFAFTIKDIKGTEITGTNTMFEKSYMDNLSEGDNKIINFSQRAIMQGGNYLISLGVTGYEGDDFVCYHRLYDVMALNVVSSKDTVGYYDCESEIVIN